MKENISEFYYKRMMESENPANELMRFYCAAVNKEPNTTDIIIFRDLVRVFGRVSTFNGVLDLSTKFSSISAGGLKHVESYLKKIISNKRKEDLRLRTNTVDLSDYIAQSMKDIEDAKKRLNDK